MKVDLLDASLAERLVAMMAVLMVSNSVIQMAAMKVSSMAVWSALP